MRMDREPDALGCLLDCLPPSVRFRLLPELQRVELAGGRVLHDFLAPSHVHFIRSGFVSVTYVTANGETGEIASVGNEGMVGMTALLGDGLVTGTRAVVRTPGAEAYAMRADAAVRAFRQEPAFQAMVMRHVRWMFSQFAQAAICSRHHPLERQLARWLLLGFDRTGDAPLLVTHETLASLLGVRREGVTEAARKLQDAGAISYSRGCIRLEQRDTLEQRACECYGLLHRQYAGLVQCAVAHGAAPFADLT